MADRARLAISRLDTSGVSVGASIGGALTRHGADAAPTLMRTADEAMYRAKAAGGDGFFLSAQTAIAHVV
jgi:GGDEF domain-containing protein